MGKMANENPDPSFKEARVAGIKNKLRRAEEMKKVRREKKKVCTLRLRVVILLKHRNGNSIMVEYIVDLHGV